MALKLRIDPWATEYEGALHLQEELAEPAVDVDLFVETDDWRPIALVRIPKPEVIVFIDGVQRVEVRVLAERDGDLVYGAFASLAVGAALTCAGDPRTLAQPPRRTLALADGASTEPVAIPCGSLTLQFEVQSTAATGPRGVQEAVDAARREAETRLGQAMVEQGYPLVIVDGRLSFQPTRRSMAVGFVKTMHRRYLDPPQAAILSQLLPGTRTPLFRVSRDRPVYSWYVRLNERRPIEHPWAGLARLETLEGIGLEAAVHLADLTALHLPAFASSAAWDPRAPQNLYPISALEQQLRHQLGDHEWIRRAIEGYLLREGEA